ncbi:Crossover junction endonuclease EME1B-like protein [Drosera capensis]
MSNPVHVDILSDSDDSDPSSTPLLDRIKRRRRHPPPPNPTVFVIDDDDPTPVKPRADASTSTPSFVAETPLSELSKSEARIVKCTSGFSGSSREKFSGTIALICLESDNESGDELTRSKHYDEKDCEVNKKGRLEEEEITIQVNKSEADSIALKKKDDTSGKAQKQKMTKEEKARQVEERKLRMEHDKLHKAALKAKAAESKKLAKELKKWEKGKFAINSIVAQIDRKVVESGQIGGNLLTRLAEKGLRYSITSNPVEGSILWNMTAPEQFSQISSIGSEVPYILLVYEAESFCKLALDASLFNHISDVQSRYPSYTVCCITNRLMSYINKREQEKYKNPGSRNDWRRPPIEEVFATLCIQFEKVHSRQCVDEAEFADHVVGLTINLAKCRFRRKLTRLSVNANGAFIPKDCFHRDIILKSPWLKSLIAIPKVQPRFAIAIWKKYPTMKSLFSVYMDPSKSVHEKEFLLKDLKVEGSCGTEDRRLGEVCSKRVYRILMAQNGSILTDDIEDGADYFQDTGDGEEHNIC